jgi:hypothetical protein
LGTALLRFARRGIGFNAVRGSSNSLTDNTTELVNGLYVVRLKTFPGTMTKQVMVPH